MNYNPTLDGIDHINIYSQGKTKLGKLLTNFAAIPITIDNTKFASLEAYWYFLGVNWSESSKIDQDKLQRMSGFEAKKLGREMKKKYREKELPDFQQLICRAMRLKVEQHPEIAQLLRESSLPEGTMQT